MADYTAWPTASDVVAVLDQAGVSLTSRPPSVDYLNRKIAAVTQEVTKRTHRQFVAASATRYFDGSGTGTLEVDECVSLTSVTVLGWIGAAQPITLDNVYLRQDNTYPNTIIEIFQSSLPAVSYIYLNAFPAGRQNVGVTANWGYASTIPADLWESVAEESAKRIAEELIFKPDGRLKSWTEADVKEEYALALPGEAAGWHTNFEDKVRAYTRDVNRIIRKMRPAMI